MLLARQRAGMLPDGTTRSNGASAGPTAISLRIEITFGALYSTYRKFRGKPYNGAAKVFAPHADEYVQRI